MLTASSSSITMPKGKTGFTVESPKITEVSMSSPTRNSWNTFPNVRKRHFDSFDSLNLLAPYSLNDNLYPLMLNSERKKIEYERDMKELKEKYEKLEKELEEEKKKKKKTKKKKTSKKKK